MKVMPTSRGVYAALAILFLLPGCLGSTKRDKEEPTGKSIPEITKLLKGDENAMVYYWLYRTQAENIRANPSIDANQAERIGFQMVENMGLKKGAVDGLAKAIEKQLQPWAGDKYPADWPDGYCDKLMEIAESCRRAAK